MQRRRWLTKLVDPRFDWRLLQNFLDLVESGSFRSASVERRAALNTVRARGAELERLTGRKLIERRQQGITPTADGEIVLAVIRAMVETRNATVASLVE